MSRRLTRLLVRVDGKFYEKNMRGGSHSCRYILFVLFIVVYVLLFNKDII